MHLNSTGRIQILHIYFTSIYIFIALEKRNNNNMKEQEENLLAMMGYRETKSQVEVIKKS